MTRGILVVSVMGVILEFLVISYRSLILVSASFTRPKLFLEIFLIGQIFVKLQIGRIKIVPKYIVA